MSQDQSFFNVFMLVIGTLIAITIFLIFLARSIGGDQQLSWVRESKAYNEAVDQRIAPVGQVALPGTPAATAPAEPAAAAAAPAPAAAKLTGEQVYNAACFACHAQGVGGAPKIGDHAAWAPRIAQGKATLYQHALQGFQGKAGVMPPKGGRVDLSDGEIEGAVDYMLGKAG